jgi:thioredoxin-related protein
MLKTTKFIAGAFLGSLLFSTAYSQGIQFAEQGNWEQIKARAAAEHKFVFVDAYATWCGPCKKMDREVYTDAAVGEYVNDKFIALKVQVDKTDKDNEFTKFWYNDAAKLQQTYSISELPTFLFFNEKGELVQRQAGYLAPDAFIALCKTATDTANNYTTWIGDYKAGKVKGEALLDLALKVKSFKQDSLATVIAKKYRATVLDKQAPEKLMTPRVLKVIGEFPGVYHVDDKLIRYIYKNPAKADTGMANPGGSKKITNFYVAKDYVNSVAMPNGKPSATVPDWKSLQAKIAKQFDETTAKETVLPAKVTYYERKEDWDNMIAAWLDKIETNGVNMNDMFGSMEVNNTIYEVIFKRSNDPAVLKKSIGLMEKLLEINPESDTEIDTYAAILYKSGQKEKAIEQEKKAQDIARKRNDDRAVKEYQKYLDKMEKGEKTWVD